MNRPSPITATNALHLAPQAETRRGWISDLAWSPNGQSIAVASAGGITFHHVATLQPLGALEGHTAPVKGIAVNRHGTLLASASADTTVRLWDLQAGGKSTILNGHTDAVGAVAFSPDGTLLASAGADQTVRLWELPSGAQRQTLRGHIDEISSLAFALDGAALTSGSWDHTVQVWEVTTGELQAVLRHDDWVRHLCASPNQTLLASAGKDGTVRLSDVQAGMERICLQAHLGGVDCAAFSPDAQLLATSGRDLAIKFWSLPDGDLIHTIRVHEKPVLTLAFSPDGARLATGSGDNTLRVWGIS